MNPVSLTGHIMELLELAEPRPPGSATGTVDAAALPSDTIVANFFRQRKYLGSHDRRYISGIFYSILRNRRYLDTLLDRCLAEPGMESILPEPRYRSLPLLVLAFLTVDQRPLEEIFQAIGSRWKTVFPRVSLDRFVHFADQIRDLPFLDSVQRPGVLYSFPDWMVRAWEKQFPGEVESLLQALNREAPTVLRVNLLKCSREECQSRLALEGIETAPAQISPAGLIVTKRFNKNTLQSFREGWFEVQDEGSQLVSLMLPVTPGKTVIDACAGAGGKTLHVAELMRDTGRIFAMDSDPRRLEELERRSMRAGLKSVHVRMPGTYPKEEYRGMADLVLVDAPCSGSGTIRRNPALKWSTTESLVKHFAGLQIKILTKSSEYVKPGGVLAYITCSLFGAENEEVVGSFLSSAPEFRIVCPATVYPGAMLHPDGAISFLPHTMKTDGFFICVMGRQER